MMKQVFFILFVVFLQSACPVFAQNKDAPGDQLEWYTDVIKANEQSKLTQKPIFGFFTGSDWCVWCKRLQNAVFEKPAFIKWAKENVVLLELDYPRHKQLPAELAQQNNSLLQAFKVTGFPTVWIFLIQHDEATNKMNITSFGSLGYPSGAEPGKEEEKFLNVADDILRKIAK